MKNFEIDFVVPWVDGSDSDWIAEFNKYCPKEKRIIDASEKRYRDFGLLKYWFRGVEKFAPWVRKIHFITCGQKPEWLNVEAEKLHWVKHSDYIPAEYLPVFSSHPIELMMHKIEGLAEHFVYFNDDFFLTAPVAQSVYFKRGLPCDAAILGAIGHTSVGHILLNNNECINSKFYKKEVLKTNMGKWFSLTYGFNLLRTAQLLPFYWFTGFHNQHFSIPYTKSLLEEVWKTFPGQLENTMQHKFRSQEDVSQYLFQDYRLCKGDFIPFNVWKNRSFIYPRRKNIDSICSDIRRQKYREIVINDSDEVEFEFVQNRLIKAFDSILPAKSSFEL